MFCTKCGAEIENNASFCTSCGSKVEQNEEKNGLVIFARASGLYGVIVPIHIYVDGQKVASVNAGEEARVPLSIGKHKFSFDLWSGTMQYDLDISESNPNVKITFKLKAGLITSKPTVIKIENI